MKDVLYVPGLKNNLLSISTLDAKRSRVTFVDGQVLMWPRGKTIDNATVIGEQEGGLCKLKEQTEQALVHDFVKPSELWHRRLTHVLYQLQAKQYQVFLNSKKNMKELAKDVRKGRT